MRQAMIFAAGLGTRLKPLTDYMPKALLEVGGKPLLAHVINRLREAGIECVVVNVHHFAQQIIDYVSANDFGVQVLISDESDTLLDTGGGLKRARHLFASDSSILIHNVDILSNVDLRAFNDTDGTMLLVSERVTKRYLLFDDNMRLVGWTNIETGEIRSPYNDINPEKCQKLAFSGIHAFSPKLFPLMENFPDRFGIIDFYLKVCDKVDIHGYTKTDLLLMDVGKQDTLAQAESFMKMLNEK